ncbi:MAG: hypothetical protein HKN87_08890 [Saprospiraceae bacterium]|nr:hypothetical protein [Saprospiraceae bacterium]
MRKMLLILGIMLCLIGTYSLVEYTFDYGELTDYGRGFIWGKALVILIGISLILFSLRKNPTKLS